MESLRSQLLREKQKSKTLAKERTELKRELASAQKSIKRLETVAAKHQEELTQAHKRFKLSHPTVGDLVAMIDKLFRERAVIEKGLRSAQTNAERQIAESKARAQAAESGLENALKEIDLLKKTDDTAGLIKENRRLATELEAAESDLHKFREAVVEAKETLKRSRAEIEKTLRLELGNEFKAEKDRLTSQVATLTSQLKTKGKTPFLNPDEASGLVDEFVSKLRKGANGLVVRRGELRLKVAFGSTGERVGFVVPTAESSKEVQAYLHEVVLGFDQLDKKN